MTVMRKLKLGELMKEQRKMLTFKQIKLLMERWNGSVFRWREIKKELGFK